LSPASADGGPASPDSVDSVDSVAYYVRGGPTAATRLYRIVRSANIVRPERFDRWADAWVWDAAFLVRLRRAEDPSIVEIDATEAVALEVRLREQKAKERARRGTGVWADY
jgi:hypothetical protein